MCITCDYAMVLHTSPGADMATILTNPPPTRAISANAYRGMRKHAERYAASDYATPEQRRAIATILLDGLDEK